MADGGGDGASYSYLPGRVGGMPHREWKSVFSPALKRMVGTQETNVLKGICYLDRGNAVIRRWMKCELQLVVQDLSIFFSLLSDFW